MITFFDTPEVSIIARVIPLVSCASTLGSDMIGPRSHADVLLCVPIVTPGVGHVRHGAILQGIWTEVNSEDSKKPLPHWLGLQKPSLFVDGRIPQSEDETEALRSNWTDLIVIDGDRFTVRVHNPHDFSVDAFVTLLFELPKKESVLCTQQK